LIALCVFLIKISTYLSKKKKKPVDGWTEKIHHKPDAVNLQNIYAGPQDALITFTHMNDN